MSIDRDKAVGMGFLKPTKKATNAKGKPTTVKARKEASVAYSAKKVLDKQETTLTETEESLLAHHLLKKWNVEPLRIIAEIAMNGESDAVRLNAAKDLANREGKYLEQKAVEKVEHSGQFEFNINIQGPYKMDDMKPAIGVESE